MRTGGYAAIVLVLLRGGWATTYGAENATGIVPKARGPEQRPTADGGQLVADGSQLVADGAPGPAANGTDDGRAGAPGPAKNPSDVVRVVDVGLAAAEGNGNRSARQAVEQRDQRCALQELQQVSVGDDDDDDETVLEATRTVDRYRLRPVASYVSPVVYRERPAAVYRERPAAVYVRRRRPVLVVNRAQQKPIAAAASYYFQEPAADAVAMQTMRGPPLRIGLPYAQRVVVDGHQTGGKRDDDVQVSLMPDDIRRLLQRVFSEGVIAGEAAATVPKLSKDHPPTG